MFDGRKVTTAEQWRGERRPELVGLFQHYMYGTPPPPPGNVRGEVRRSDPKALDGKATLREITLTYGPAGAPPIEVLLLIPNRREGPVPAFVCLDFHGNHTVLADPGIALPRGWVPERGPGVKDNRATESGRGGGGNRWDLGTILDRGYALAIFYHGDVDPDRPDFSDGIQPFYYKEGQTRPGPHEWGTIAAWAWGVSRVVDHLVTVPEIDPARIAVFGHSRNGKAALLAAALDERIAAAFPNGAGCGGTSPSRGTVGESVSRINDHYPYWFNDTFHLFGDRVDRLPFDQHGLIALVAPRPVLLTNATGDTWANPKGQFEMLKAATPVYRLLGSDGMTAAAMPPEGTLIDSPLGFHIRPGGHDVKSEDWGAILAFADRRLRSSKFQVPSSK